MNGRMEKRVVMFPVKRLVSGGMAAVLALALIVPTTLANTLAGRDVREKNVKGTGQYQPVPHQRNYAKRNEGGEVQRPQRLSPEERRQLRRDIKEAGREIYLPRR